jgi:hypothetical protein
LQGLAHAKTPLFVDAFTDPTNTEGTFNGLSWPLPLLKLAQWMTRSTQSSAYGYLIAYR